MRQIAYILLLTLFSSEIFGQSVLTIEGTLVNDSQTGSWGGVNISRNQPTTFTYRNNSITSVNSTGYMLQAGDDWYGNTNNNLEGELITGNKLIKFKRYSWYHDRIQY